MNAPISGPRVSGIARVLSLLGFGRPAAKGGDAARRVPTPDAAPLPRLLLISHRGERCGVQQFGRRLFDCLEAGGGATWRYVECGSTAEALTAAAEFVPDAILLNYHPNTLAWALDLRVDGAAAPLYAVYHEAHQIGADALTGERFDFHVCPDPTLLPHNARVLPVPRFIPEPLLPAASAPGVFTVGSFGFATGGKGFERLCGLVNAQFDVARIRINMPAHDDPALAPFAADIAAACREEITKPGIVLEITDHFMDEAGLVAFLAENTLNAFLYDDTIGRGISSCVDYALASGRPLAVSGSSMFRHVHTINPSIVASERGLLEIAATGSAPLRAHVAQYAPAASGAAWTRAMLGGLGRHRTIVSEGVLNARITEGTAGEPDFAMRAVGRLLAGVHDARVLSIGAPDSPVALALRAHGWRLDTIVPGEDGDGVAAAIMQGDALVGSYDLVLGMGVLDGIEADERFVRMAADLLAPGGCAVFSVRLGTRGHGAAELRGRLMRMAPDCGPVDPDSWGEAGDGEDHTVGWVFRKFDLATQRHAFSALASIRSGAPRPLQLLFELEAYGTLHHGLHSVIGKTSGSSDVAVFEADGSLTGFLAFGPYCALPAGIYLATFLMRLGACDVGPDTVIATIDSALDRVEQPPLREVRRDDLTIGENVFVTARLVLERDVEAVEVRILLNALVPVAVVGAVAIRREADISLLVAS